MFRILHGSTLGLTDTTAFIETVGRLLAGESGGLKDFFDGRGEVFVARAPGRLDLMGGIADYSGSLVLELPIASAVHAAVQTGPWETIRVVSLLPADGQSQRTFEMPLADLRGREGRPLDYAGAARYFKREPAQHWGAYVAGAFVVLARERDRRFERGARVLIRSDVPEGKGVSSSAALEVATMQAVAAAYDIKLEPRELAFLCQKVENFVACAPCGVMDQMTSACGEADKLLALLCQPGELKGTRALPLELEVWGVDSGIRHSVGGADYGSVRTAAFMGYRIIAEMAGLRVSRADGRGHVSVEDPKWSGYLANVTPQEFEERYADGLPPRMPGAEFLERYGGITDPVTSVDPKGWYHVRPAARHPVHEHARVTRFAALLGEGAARAVELGELMYQSHESYSSCGLGSPGTDEIVRLVREAGPAAGLYGAKITGGGGGGTVAVLGRRGAGGAVEAIAREYGGHTGRSPLVISGSSPGAGAFGILKLVGGGRGRLNVMAILVTGGAGYIGSVMVDQLADAGERVVVIDDLSRGHGGALRDGVPFYEGRLGERELITRVCREHAVEACIHFAALAYVGESVTEPARYFENNVAQGLALLDALLACGVRRLVFSSTCATYGEPVRVPIDERHPQQPTNPYGWSKFFMERILESYDRAYGLKFVALRYFNAAGATRERGEHHEPETHLIPNVLAAAAGRLPFVSIFGKDYPTPDGTAIRDHIHVSDLCSAHALALRYLRRGGQSEFINLGNGRGYSVMEVIEAARRVTGRGIEVRVEPARAGDPSQLVADASKARELLGWRTDYPEIEVIIRSAWEWHESHPEGYKRER